MRTPCCFSVIIQDAFLLCQALVFVASQATVMHFGLARVHTISPQLGAGVVPLSL